MKFYEEKKLITKIFEVKKNNLSKTIILKVVNIIKKKIIFNFVKT